MQAKTIIDKLNQQLDKYYSFSELEKQYLLQKDSLDNEVGSKLKNLSDEVDKVKAEINEKKSYYSTLYEDKLKGIISENDFIMFRDKFNQECKEKEKRLASLEEQILEISNKKKDVNNSIKIFEKYKHITELTKEIVDEFIDCIWIGKVDEQTGKRDVEIEMNIIKLV